MLLNLNKLLGLLFFIFYCVPLSIGQKMHDKATNTPVELENTSLPKAPKTGTFQEQQKTTAIITEASKVISANAPKMIFGEKNTKLRLNTEGGRHDAFDQILTCFEQTDKYKLIIRVKNNRELSKQRIAYLYSYIFKNANLSAPHVEIKSYTPKDAAYFWIFENDEIAVSFDAM